MGGADRYAFDMSAQPPIKVAVVGAGHVGATFAYALLLSGLAAEIVLVDADADRAEGEAMDISHAVPLSRPTRVRSGTYDDCAGASIAVIAAGSGQRPGESRLDLAGRNAAVIGAIIPRLADVAPEAVVVVATNPVDVLTAHALGLGRFPTSRVMGSGTILDTARFRALLSEHFRVDARSVHAFVIGEHGDSEVPLWSLANIAGMRLEDFAAGHGIEWSQADRTRIGDSTRTAAAEIIARKGATYYAVATGLVRIVEAILRDQRTVLSVSTGLDGAYGISGVALSLPTIVGRDGVEEVLHLPLDADEVLALRRSADVLRATMASIGDRAP